jgi:hypothetical protein
MKLHLVLWVAKLIPDTIDSTKDGFKSLKTAFTSRCCAYVFGGLMVMQWLVILRLLLASAWASSFHVGGSWSWCAISYFQRAVVSLLQITLAPQEIVFLGFTCGSLLTIEARCLMASALVAACYNLIPGGIKAVLSRRWQSLTWGQVYRNVSRSAMSRALSLQRMVQLWPYFKLWFCATLSWGLDETLHLANKARKCNCRS